MRYKEFDVKKEVITIFLLYMAILAYAEDSYQAATITKAAISIGPEWNMNSRDNFAAGAVLAFDFNLGSSFALGINATASSNFDGIFVIEPAAMFRWYFLSREHIGWFAQADAGMSLILEDGDTTSLLLGGLRAGLRLPLGDKFFVEPFGRLGYPFVFGVGGLVGVRF